MSSRAPAARTPPRTPTRPAPRRAGAPARHKQPLQLLEGARLRVTAARTAVLAALAGLRQWASHAEIAQALPEPLDRVTLYRTLDTLVEARLVARNVGDDRIGRFALAGEGAHDEHAHFHCADCGRVFCLPTPVPRRMSVPGGFAVQAVDLNVRGRCDACSARAG